MRNDKIFKMMHLGPPLKKVLVLSGPTGVGKTAIAVLLGSLLDGEIISCDSVQVYNELVIGANKETKLSIPQHLVDLVSWQERNFTNADFHARCLEKIDEIISRGKVPLLVGGTGFYTKWIIEGRPSCPPPSKETLAMVNEMLEGRPWEEAIKLLEAVDPEYAASLYKNDRYRLKRAMANHLQTGQTMSTFKPITKEAAKYDFRCFYLSKDRPTLSLQIGSRCEKMIANGLLKEVGELWLQGLAKDCPAGRAIGYAETIDFIQELSHMMVGYGEGNLFKNEDNFLKSEKVISMFRKYLDQFKAASRQYSRRQDAWHRNLGFRWIDSSILQKQLNSIDADPHVMTAEYLAHVFNLSRTEWETNAELGKIHEESLETRWSDAIRKSMKTYQRSTKEDLRSIFASDEVCHSIMQSQLGPILRQRPAV